MLNILRDLTQTHYYIFIICVSPPWLAMLVLYAGDGVTSCFPVSAISAGCRLYVVLSPPHSVPGDLSPLPWSVAGLESVGLEVARPSEVLVFLM